MPRRSALILPRGCPCSVRQAVQAVGMWDNDHPLHRVKKVCFAMFQCSSSVLLSMNLNYRDAQLCRVITYMFQLQVSLEVKRFNLYYVGWHTHNVLIDPSPAMHVITMDCKWKLWFVAHSETLPDEHENTQGTGVFCDTSKLASFLRFPLIPGSPRCSERDRILRCPRSTKSAPSRGVDRVRITTERNETNGSGL